MSSDFTGFAKDRVIVMSAPNGARRSRAEHPALPITATELAENAVALRDAGVSVLHLHVRDEQGGHTLEPAQYREAIAAIRERVGDELILQVTTEAVGMYSPEEQMAVIRELEPEAVSLALRELCPNEAAEPAFAAFCEWMHERRIWPQYILYSVADVERFDAMRRCGTLAAESPFALFVLGNYAAAIAGEVADLDALLEATDASRYPWAVCCFGPNEHRVMLAAHGRGGHVRIGFENNVMLPDGTVAPDNAALVRVFTGAIAAAGREPATAGEIRAGFIAGRDWLLS